MISEFTLMMSFKVKSLFRAKKYQQGMIMFMQLFNGGVVLNRRFAGI